MNSKQYQYDDNPQLTRNISEYSQAESQGQCEYIEEDDDSMIPEDNSRKEKQKYLKSSQIYDRLMNKIDEVNELLSTDQDTSLLVFHYYRWNFETLQEKYFNEMETVFKQLGFDNSANKFHSNIDCCEICFRNLNKDNQYHPGCGHYFCKECWNLYIINKIQDKIVFIKCMKEGCNIYIKHSEIMNELLQETQKPLYKKNLCRSYIEESKTLIYCPSIDCDCIVDNEYFSDQFVTCPECKYEFCFKCKNEYHKPTECEYLKKWEEIVKRDEANLKWIKLNTKTCPFCKKSVERSMGCNFMHCAPPGGCSKNFCYVCEDPWEPDHQDHFKCNKPQKKMDQEKEKNILERMNFYFEKFRASEHSRKSAQDYLKNKAQKLQDKIYEQLGINLKESDFLKESLEILIKARQALQWSYCYAYFMDPKQVKTCALFQDFQGQFEGFCENLAFIIDQKLAKFIEDSVQNKQQLDNLTRNKEFFRLKEQIISLAKSTDKTKSNMVESIESGKIYID